MNLKKTKFQGVYYRESDNKTYKNKPDRCYYIKYYVNSKQKQEKVGWISEGYNPSIAHKIRNDRIHNYRNHSEIGFIQNNISFSEGANKYLAWAKLNKKKISTEKSMLNKLILSEFGDMPLNIIKPADVQKFYEKLQRYEYRQGKKYTPQTIEHYIILIRRIYNYLISSGDYVGINPASKKYLQMQKFNNERNEYLHDDEIERFVKVCEIDSTIPEEDRLLLLFALYTGMRRGEIFSLKWDDIDLDKKLCFLRDPKGKKDMHIPLSNSAISILNKIEKKSELVFPSRVSGKKRSDIKKLWNKVKKKAKLREHLYFHDLRHTFGTLLASAGVDLHTIQKLMTHKDYKTTQRYARIKDERMFEAIDVLEKKIKKDEK